MDQIDADFALPLERAPTAPRAARARIRELLGDAVSPQFVEDAQLLTSELVTNAVTYSSDGCRLSAWFRRARGVLRVEVSDTDSRRPEVGPEPVPGQVGGRGLRLVASRAAEWGVRPTAEGKSVWFELRC